MTYYKVKAKYDQKARKDGSFFVENELYTKTEMKKYSIPMEYVEPVELKRNDTFFFFGARFN